MVRAARLTMPQSTRLTKWLVLNNKRITGMHTSNITKLVEEELGFPVMAPRIRKMCEELDIKVASGQKKGSRAEKEILDILLCICKESYPNLVSRIESLLKCQ